MNHMVWPFDRRLVNRAGGYRSLLNLALTAADQCSNLLLLFFKKQTTLTITALKLFLYSLYSIYSRYVFG
jgi:hypothetical protein